MLVSIIVTLVILAVVLYLVGMIPMDATLRTIIRALCVVAALIAILNSAGFLHLYG